MNSHAQTECRAAVVCAVAPGPSHTYIRAHVEHLSGGIPVIHGRVPMVGAECALDRFSLFTYRVRRKLLGESEDVQQTAGYLRALGRLRPSVVLAEFGDIGVRVMDACARLSIPLVVHFHGRDASRRSVLEIHKDTYPRMFSQAAGIVAVSREMVRVLGDLGCPEHKLHYIPCGVDPDVFQGAAPDASPPVFLAVGRLIEKKGPLTTIAAFKEVALHVRDAKLRIIGDGALRHACEQLITQLRLEHAVTLLGSQPNEIVRSELRGARAFVQHSMRAAAGDTEGTPVAILEAGASGLPTVATRHAGIPDVVVDGETGFLVDEGDAGAMARAIVRLAESPDVAARLGRAARTRVIEEFSSAASLARLRTVLEHAARS